MTEFISSSYNPEDVTFLLQEVSIDPTGIAEKEHLIQSGRAHYSEMISEERRPDARYMDIFHEAADRGVERIAREVISIAEHIAQRIDEGSLPAEITLCSLVRAGVPYGVMLRRELVRLGVDVTHYGISIIRDKGLDKVAMDYILERHVKPGILFVDGWTGKGAISNELRSSWRDIAGCDPILVTLADPSGYAEITGSHEDWLIPSGILGANISGLISRSILNDEVRASGGFHGSIPVHHLADIDLSARFADMVCAGISRIRAAGPVTAVAPCPDKRRVLRDEAMSAISRISDAFDVENLNRIKPGIAEATRAVLRRKPERVFVRSLSGDPDLQALLHLCLVDGVVVVESPEMTGPYRAITLIGKVI